MLLILFYATIKFHDNDDPVPTTEDPSLEVTWTAATALILLFVGVSGYTVLVSPYVSPGQPTDLAGDGPIEDVADLPDTDDEEFHVRGFQWGWEVTYPEADATTRNELVIPADEDVTLWLTTDDVTHSLFVPELGVKQDAFPGEYTQLRTSAYEAGEYDAQCVEFCGAGHSRMGMTVVVLEPDDYESWLTEHEGTTNATAPTADG